MWWYHWAEAAGKWACARIFPQDRRVTIIPAARAVERRSKGKLAMIFRFSTIYSPLCTGFNYCDRLKRRIALAFQRLLPHFELFLAKEAAR